MGKGLPPLAVFLFRMKMGQWMLLAHHLQSHCTHPGFGCLCSFAWQTCKLQVPLWLGWLFRQVFVAAAWRKCYPALPYMGRALPSPMEGHSWFIQSSRRPSSSGAWWKARSAGWDGGASNLESSSGLFDWSFATLSTAGNGSGMTPGQRDSIGRKNDIRKKKQRAGGALLHTTALLHTSAWIMGRKYP